MNILYVDLQKHDTDEILTMVRQIESAFGEDMPLLVIPNDCRFIEDASYTDLINIKIMIDKALEEKEKNDISSK